MSIVGFALLVMPQQLFKKVTLSGAAYYLQLDPPRELWCEQKASPNSTANGCSARNNLFPTHTLSGACHALKLCQLARFSTSKLWVVPARFC